MQQEKYQPTPEETKKSEDMLTSEEKTLSEARERSFESRVAKGFRPINPQTIDSDVELKEFLSTARVSTSRKGDGVFISGARGADTSKFRKYGIPVQGALIVPIREDVALEVERISLLAETLRNESSQKEELIRKEKQEEAKVAVIKKNKQALAPLLDLFNEYTGLIKVVGLETENGYENPHIEVFVGKSRVLSLYGTSMNVEDIRRMLETERVQAPLRSIEFIKKIGELQKQLRMAQLNGIEYWGWGEHRYGSAELYERPEEAVMVQSFNFGRISVGWSPEDYIRLEEVVRENIRNNSLQREKEMSVIRQMSFSGVAVQAKPWEFGSKGSFPTRLEVDGKIIEFQTMESAKEAEKWALDNGAFLPYHHALGERLRDQAKREQWNESQSRVALKILNGSMPELKEYTYEGRMPDRNGGGRTTGHAKGWFVDDIHIGYYGPEKDGGLKFALKLFCELNAGSTILQAKQIPDFNTASDDELEGFGKMLIHDKKLFEKREEVKKLRIKVYIHQSESRTKGYTVAEAEGLFDDVIKSTISKIDYYSTPRRGFSISVTRMNEDGTEGHKEDHSCFKGEEVINYIKNLKKTRFIYGLEDFPELVTEVDLIKSGEDNTKTKVEQPVSTTRPPESMKQTTDDVSKGLTHNPFNDALKNWGKEE